jgi:hypothetical protein
MARDDSSGFLRSAPEISGGKQIPKALRRNDSPIEFPRARDIKGEAVGDFAGRRSRKRFVLSARRP